MSEDKHTERECTAYHEAGHAVVAWVLGIDLSAVTIVAGEDFLGRAYTKRPDREAFETDLYKHSPEYALVRADAIGDVAGKVAEELHEGTSHKWSEVPYAGDYAHFIELALRLGWGAHNTTGSEIDMTQAFADAEAEARDLLQTRWVAVQGVAAVLLRDGGVPGTDAVAIMENAGVPGPVESVWADLLEERQIEAEMRARFDGASGEPIEIPREELEG